MSISKIMQISFRCWVAAHMCVLSHFRTCDVRAEVRAERVFELWVRCRCVRAFLDLRCAIALSWLIGGRRMCKPYICITTYYMYLFTVYIFVYPSINQGQKYHYILYLFTVYIFVCLSINQNQKKSTVFIALWKEKLCVPSTAPVERMFSHGGIILSKTRAQLFDEKILMQLSLEINQKFLKGEE